MLSLKKLKKSLESLLKAKNMSDEELLNEINKPVDHQKLHSALDEAFDNPHHTSKGIIKNLIGSPDVRSDHIKKAIDMADMDDIETAKEAFKNPKINEEHIQHGINNPNRYAFQATMAFAPLTKEHIRQAWNKPTDNEFGHKHSIAAIALRNPRASLPEEVFQHIRNNPSSELIYDSMVHRNTPVEHARWGLKSAQTFKINEVALAHPGLESQDLERFLNRNPQIRGNDSAGEAALRHPNLSKEQLDRVAATSGDLAHAAVSNKKADADTLNLALQNPNLSDLAMREIMNHPQATQEMFDTAMNTEDSKKKSSALSHGADKFLQPHHVQSLIDKNDIDPLTYLRPGHPAITPDHIRQIHGLGNPVFDREIVARSEHITPDMIKTYIKDMRYSNVLRNLLDVDNGEKLNHEHIALAANHPDPNIRISALSHVNVGEDAIRSGLKSNIPEVRETAKEHPLGQRLWLEQNPDKHQVKVKFDTGKLRQIRDFIEESGGTVPKKQLESMGYNLQSLGLNTALDHKGNLSAAKVSDLIQNRPEHKFGYSFEKWDGPQRHSNSKSNVFQLNLTHEMLKEINDHGLNDTFKKIQDISKNSNHPVKGHTIGWARYTRGKDGGTHVDEIQSDLGQGLVKQIKNMKESGQAIDIDPEKVNELNKIIFKDKHPSELVHEAFLQAMRDKGRVGNEIHIWGKDQRAKMSDLNTRKELPAHITEGYEKIPKKLGYQEGEYGDLKTHRNQRLIGHQTWKQKLRKSMPHKDGKFHASMVAVFVGPEMLFIRRDDSGLLTRPGGHAEPGEDALSAAVRELNEEVGIVASPNQLKFVGSKETPRDTGGTTVVSVFKLDLPSKPELDYSKDPDQEASSCVWSQPNLIKESELHHRPDVVVELLKPKSLKQLKKSIENLEKGLHGDWQKEGYSFYHLPDKNDPTRFVVYASHPSEGDVGYARFKIINDDYIIPYDHDSDSASYVQEEHRRKGIGSELYTYAENETGLRIRPSEMQSDSAEALWSNPNRKFGKSENKPNNGWLIKIEGEEGYHPLKDIKDLGYNQGNNYVLRDGREFHQSHIEDMIPDNDEVLEKGLNGDWKEEGYTISHKVSPQKNYLTGEQELHVEATDKHGRSVGNLKLHDHGDHLKAAANVYVRSPDRRKGLAIAMYQHAEKAFGKPIKRHNDDMQTESGKALWTGMENLQKDMPMPPPLAEVREVEPPIVTHPTIRFYKGPDIKVVKNVISQIESSGGKFREHPEVKVGVHAGTKAHSSYGLMPKLMQELAQKKKDFAKTPTGLKILASGSPEEVSNITADKKHDDEAMRHLWEYNQSRIKKFAPQGADMELLGAYAHRRGIKGTYDALQNGGLEAIHKDPYVSKFKQLRNKIKSMGKSLESDVIPGGLSDKKSDKDFDPKLVREGVKVELEHTQDPRIAKEIAMDHLVESPSYYKMLRKLESMMKAERRNGTVYPDKEGETHPIKSDRHAVKVDGRLVWAYKPEHAARMDANLARDVKDYSAYLSPEKKKLLNDLHNVVKNDPNRHVISNTGNSPAMRQRHFHSALRAQEGYSLNFDNGITISANRHSDSNKTNNQKDSWKFDETGLKYSGSEPISKSMGENNENTKRNRLDDRTGVQRVFGTNRASLAKSGRDLSRNGGDVLDGKRGYVSSGSETENGRVVQAVRGGETSAPGKLQSAKQLKESIEALEKNNDYRISHTAPSGEDGVGAMHDLKNTFPEDIYSHEAVKLYGHGRPDDIVSINAIHSARGNPGKKIKIYRAVPDKKSPGELIQKYQEHKKHVMKTGQIPKDAEGKWNNSSDYYDHISSKIDELLPRANEPREQLNINPGDWVTTARGYAKDHGEAVHGKGNYKILAMTVPAGHLYTDGDIHEWGYNPSNPGPKGKLNKNVVSIHKKPKHMEHLLNGVEIHSVNHSKQSATLKAKELRHGGVYASIFKDPVRENGKNYIVTVPEKLEKGLNGDWQKEGYKISHVSYPEAPHIIHVKAHKDGQLVGELHAKKRGDTAYSDLVHVDRNHRRKGIASAMYAHAEKNFNVKMTPASEVDQTEAGKKLWEGTRSSKPFGKSEELNKALEIPQAMANTTADGLIYRPQTKYVRIKSEVAGTHPKTGQQLYHHVLKQVGHSGETKYHHILSTDTEGKNGIGALEASHMYYDNTPAIERSGVKQEHRGIGLGKMLYQKALEHHGKLKSDYSMSPSANSVWKKLGNTEGIDVKFGKEGTMEPHTAKLNKAEDEHGMTKYDLGDGYSLHHRDWEEDGMSSSGPWGTKRHYWEIHQNGNKKAVGRILIDRAPYVHDKHHSGMHVSHSWVHPKFRGLGLGQKSYQILANHYGALASDPRKTSTSAKRVWNKLNAKKAGQTINLKDRYLIQGNKKQPQIIWNEELQKDVGRIGFNLPNDKREFNKIPDRPDQEVKNVQTPKQVELGLRQAAYPDRKAFSNNTTKAAIRMAHTTLNPEKGQVKGVNVPSTLGTGKAMSLGEHHPVTAEHEGFHYLMHQIRNRHGHEAGHRFINSALAMVHPEDLHSITGMLGGGRYQDDEYLPEEKLAHIRDVLTDKNTRDVFHAHHTEKYINGESSVGIQDATNRLKTSWKAIRNMAKEVRPEHLENEDKMRMLANKHMPVYR